MIFIIIVKMVVFIYFLNLRFKITLNKIISTIFFLKVADDTINQATWGLQIALTLYFLIKKNIVLIWKRKRKCG